MRAVWLALALAACASTPIPDTVPDALRGCWIERRGAETVTFRWFPENENRTTWRGDQLFYRNGEEPAHQAYRIEPAAGENEKWGWAVCPLDDVMPHGAPCRVLYFADGGGEEYRADIRASADKLMFSFSDSGQESVFFNGARDGCD